MRLVGHLNHSTAPAARLPGLPETGASGCQSDLRPSEVFAPDVERRGECHRTSVRRVVRRATRHRRSAVSAQPAQHAVRFDPSRCARHEKLGTPLADEMRPADWQLGHARPRSAALRAAGTGGKG